MAWNATRLKREVLSAEAYRNGLRSRRCGNSSHYRQFANNFKQKNEAGPRTFHPLVEEGARPAGPVNTIRCLFGERGTPRPAVDACKALRHLTGTACGRPSGHCRRGRAQPFRSEARKGVLVNLPPKPPSLPQRAFGGEDSGARGSFASQGKRSMYSLFVL